MSTITESHIDDWDAGKAELKELIGIEPDYWTTLRGRAQFFLEGGHHERALIMLEMLEALDRSDPLATLLAVDVLLKMGRSDAAEEKIDALLERDPVQPDGLVARAELFVQTGRLVPAAELLERVIKNDPDASTEAGKRARSLAAKASAMFDRG